MVKQSKMFLVFAIVIFIIGIVYALNSETLLNTVLQKTVLPVDWEKVHPREIVKNSIPITIIEEKNDICVVTAGKFDAIITHDYFIKGDELASKLNYDRENQTIEIKCDQLVEEKSRFNVWYVTSESPVFAERYEYFVTSWNVTDPHPP
ncbi:MAG: hypothetical protein IIC67_05960 [Thaumarchaeota archaeon]|nr:hypothetical protein [Nitrososphaerota archaeon]